MKMGEQAQDYREKKEWGQEAVYPEDRRCPIGDRAARPTVCVCVCVCVRPIPAVCNRCSLQAAVPYIAFRAATMINSLTISPHLSLS